MDQPLDRSATLALFAAEGRAVAWPGEPGRARSVARSTSATISGDTGRVHIHYSGSVTTIATGRKESASGSASATYRWNGCGWSNVGVSY